MFWFVCGVAGISLFLYRRKEQVKKAVVIAHYEAIYWILGGAGMIDDLIFKFRNHVKGIKKK